MQTVDEIVELLATLKEEIESMEKACRNLAMELDELRAELKHYKQRVRELRTT